MFITIDEMIEIQLQMAVVVVDLVMEVVSSGNEKTLRSDASCRARHNAKAVATAQAKNEITAATRMAVDMRWNIHCRGCHA